MKRKTFSILLATSFVFAFSGVLLKINSSKNLGDLCLIVSTLCWFVILLSFLMPLMKVKFKSR